MRHTLDRLLGAAVLGMGCSDHILVQKVVKEVPLVSHDTADEDPEEELVCLALDSFTQLEPTTYLYDIFLVFDASGSMATDRSHVGEELPNILDSFPSRDWQAFLVPIDKYYALTDSRVPFTPGATASDIQAQYDVPPEVMYEVGFDALSTYILDNPFTAQWLRPDAIVATIFLSDENDQSAQSVQAFERFYETLGAERYLSSIVHTDSTASCYDSVSELGTRYVEATNYFGGDVLDICSDGWSSALKVLPQQVDGYTSWSLSHVPVEETITVHVNDKISSLYEWSYEPSTKEVIFAEPPAGGSDVDIFYQIDPQTIDECPEE